MINFFLRDVLKSISFFMMYFLFFIVSCFGYYDLSFTNQDELDYYYETSQIDDDVYYQYSNNFDFSEDTDKEIDNSLKNNSKFVFTSNTELDSYDNTTNNITTSIKSEYSFLNFKTGFLSSNAKNIKRGFDKESKIFINKEIDESISLDKFYFSLENFKSNNKIIAGNFDARFGLSLTFSRSHTQKIGIFKDLSKSYNRYTLYNNELYRESINSTALNGIGFYQNINNFDIYCLYSLANYPMNIMKVEGFDGKSSNKTINNIKYEEILSGYVGYKFYNFLNIGWIFYNSKYKYFEDLFDSGVLRGNGIYSSINFNNFTFESEVSFVKEAIAFISSVDFNNKDNFKFNFSYRNYPDDYINYCSDSLSLHPQNMYFRCNNEEGFRFNLDYLYLVKKYNSKLNFSLKTDIFNYSKSRVYDYKSKEYFVYYFPDSVYNSSCLNLKYSKKFCFYELGYNFYDRNVNKVSSSYNDRKDEYFSYKIGYDSKKYDFFIKYTRKIRGVDVPEYIYFGEYLSISNNVNFSKYFNFSSLINIFDKDVRIVNDNRISYIFGLNSQITNNINLKFKWFLRDNLGYFDVINSDSDFRYYQNNISNKWEFEFEFVL